MPATKKRIRGHRLPKGPNGGIELLLIQNVNHLGKQGEVVEVRPGYANNFLIPQGLATVATDHHKRMVEKHRAKLETIEKKRLAGIQQLADSIAKQSVTIEANANDEGHLYGSVGQSEIVAGLKGQGFSISQDQVRLEGPLKELGLYTVKIHLHQQIESELKVWVVPAVSDDKGVGRLTTRRRARQRFPSRRVTELLSDFCLCGMATRFTTQLRRRDNLDQAGPSDGRLLGDDPADEPHERFAIGNPRSK